MGCGIAKPARRNPIDIFIDAKLVQIERNINRYCNIFCDIFRRQGFFILL